MAGSPGATASLHMRQLGLFGMITRLPDNILNTIAKNKLFSDPDDSTSWFAEIRHLCTQYSLSSPVLLLTKPPTKTTFNSLVKKKVIDYWQCKLRIDASSKPSLPYFQPQFLTLQSPHPVFTTAKQNPFEINKSLVVSKMLSGQYMSDWHSKHWSKINKDGHCLLCPGTNVSGTLELMLVECPALDDKRRILLNFWNQQAEQNLQTLLNPQQGGHIVAPHVKIAFRTVFANFFHTTHQMYIQ